MGGSGKETAGRDSCLKAATRVQRRLMALGIEIDRLQDPKVYPADPLPVDIFLADMIKRKHAPRIVFTPKRLGDQLWTESIWAYVYAEIERAFVAAGRMPGGNRSGHVGELRTLRAWIEGQEECPSRGVPQFFTQKTTLLFSKGILEERRRDRIEVISNIEHHSPSEAPDLAQLKKWIDEDLEDTRLRKKGRSAAYQKIAFAAEIANLWNTLTGKPITKGPKTNFGQFVVACWYSGFVGEDVGADFRRAIRHHIDEVKDAQKCGRCEGCKKSEGCQHKTYFGILM